MWRCRTSRAARSWPVWLRATPFVCASFSGRTIRMESRLIWLELSSFLLFVASPPLRLIFAPVRSHFLFYYYYYYYLEKLWELKNKNTLNYTRNCKIEKRNHNKIFTNKMDFFFINLVMWTENVIWWRDDIFLFLNFNNNNNNFPGVCNDGYRDIVGNVFKNH